MKKGKYAVLIEWPVVGGPGEWRVAGDWWRGRSEVVTGFDTVHEAEEHARTVRRQGGSGSVSKTPAALKLHAGYVESHARRVARGNGDAR